MRELNSWECKKYIEPYRQKIMSDPKFLEVYRATTIPHCFELLAEKIQEELTKDYNNGKLPCMFFVEVDTENDYKLKCQTDCDAIKLQIESTEKEFEDEEVKSSLSDYSDEELLLELLCRAHRR